MPVETQTGSVQAATWTSQFVSSLPDSSFAFIDKDGNRHLPYKDADGKVDLPHVRAALARLNQVKGMSDEERAKVKTKLQNSLKNAKAADDMILRSTHAVQASDGSTTLPNRVHLLRDGNFNTQKYGEVPITASDLYEMKFNFDRGVGMANEGETGIPIDFAHQSHLNAAGWIRGLEVVQADDGTELWGTNVEWSDSGQKALLGKEYKCLSSDFYPAAFGEWADAESGITAKNVIVGAALTNRPLMTGNKPVIASEIEAEAEQEAEATGVKTVIYVNASETIKEKRMNLDQLRIKAAEDLTGAEGIFIAQHVNELSDDERKKFGLEAAVVETPAAPVVAASAVTGTEGVVSIQASDLKAIQDNNAAQAEALKAAQEGITAMQASIAKLEENNTALQASNQKSEQEKMKAIVEAAAARGAIKADRIESYTNRLVAAQGEDRDALIADLEALASNPLLAHTYGSQQTEGSAAMDVEAEIAKKVKDVMAASPSTDAYTARKQVLAADPELDARAANAVQAAMGSFNPMEAAWGTNAHGLVGVNPEVTK
ncbi:MAG TPA: hypothetical protein VNG51_19375 [Ktedonobacteraceae bacterium]|nr:hypothetical protein [Ktedonobacteraceae bacterium]